MVSATRPLECRGTTGSGCRSRFGDRCGNWFGNWFGNRFGKRFDEERA